MTMHSGTGHQTEAGAQNVTDGQTGARDQGGAPTGERADLLAMLDKHRHFLRFTTRGLTDEQAGMRTTASELCLGGLIKHVAGTERGWVDFILEGPSAMGDFDAMTERTSRSGPTSSGCCPARRWPECSTPTPRSPAAPTRSSRPCPTWTRPSRCRTRRGSRTSGGPPAGC